MRFRLDRPSASSLLVLLLAVTGLAIAACVGVPSPSLSPTATMSISNAHLTWTLPHTAIPPTFTVTPFPTATPTVMPPTFQTRTVTPTATPNITLMPTLSASTQVAQVYQRPYSTTVQIKGANQVTQTVQVGYLLYLPPGYGQDPQVKWPLVLFLHGSEERGDNPEMLTRQGLPKILEQRADFPCIVVSPQCPPRQWWWPQTQMLGAFLDQIQATYAVDNQRVYLTGISMGAYGAWALALRYPQRFAAIVPIAGGVDFQSMGIPENICALKDVPIWAFHGQRDENVPYTASENAVKAVQECGGNARLTLYPEADHAGAWELAYADPALYEWLLTQTRE